MNNEIGISPRQIAKAIDDLLDDRNDLQQRIDKAIEFITLRFNENNYLSCGAVARVLSILKGSDKE